MVFKGLDAARDLKVYVQTPDGYGIDRGHSYLCQVFPGAKNRVAKPRIRCLASYLPDVSLVIEVVVRECDFADHLGPKRFDRLMKCLWAAYAAYRDDSFALEPIHRLNLSVGIA